MKKINFLPLLFIIFLLSCSSEDESYSLENGSQNVDQITKQNLNFGHTQANSTTTSAEVRYNEYLRKINIQTISLQKEVESENSISNNFNQFFF